MEGAYFARRQVKRRVEYGENVQRKVNKRIPSKILNDWNEMARIEIRTVSRFDTLGRAGVDISQEPIWEIAMNFATMVYTNDEYLYQVPNEFVLKVQSFRSTTIKLVLEMAWSFYRIQILVSGYLPISEQQFIDEFIRTFRLKNMTIPNISINRSVEEFIKIQSMEIGNVPIDKRYGFFTNVRLLRETMPQIIQQWLYDPRNNGLKILLDLGLFILNYRFEGRDVFPRYLNDSNLVDSGKFQITLPKHGQTFPIANVIKEASTSLFIGEEVPQGFPENCNLSFMSAMTGRLCEIAVFPIWSSNNPRTHHVPFIVTELKLMRSVLDRLILALPAEYSLLGNTEVYVGLEGSQNMDDMKPFIAFRNDINTNPEIYYLRLRFMYRNRNRGGDYRIREIQKRAINQDVLQLLMNRDYETWVALIRALENEVRSFNPGGYGYEDDDIDYDRNQTDLMSIRGELIRVGEIDSRIRREMFLNDPIHPIPPPLRQPVHFTTAHGLKLRMGSGKRKKNGRLTGWMLKLKKTLYIDDDEHGGNGYCFYNVVKKHCEYHNIQWDKPNDALDYRLILESDIVKYELPFYVFIYAREKSEIQKVGLYKPLEKYELLKLTPLFIFIIRTSPTEAHCYRIRNLPVFLTYHQCCCSNWIYNYEVQKHVTSSKHMKYVRSHGDNLSDIIQETLYRGEPKRVYTEKNESNNNNNNNNNNITTVDILFNPKAKIILNWEDEQLKRSGNNNKSKNKNNQSIIDMETMEEGNDDDNDDDKKKYVAFGDFETFVDVECNNHLKVYAGSILVYNCETEELEDSSTFIGPEALADFVQFIYKWPIGMDIYFYNGSRFDFFPLLHEMVLGSLRFSFNKICCQNNRIMLIEWQTMDQVFTLRDFSLLTGGSLANTSRAFGVEEKYWKGDFDYNRVQSWESLNRYQEEDPTLMDDIKTYVEQDVYCLAHLYFNFNQTMKDKFQFKNASECMTTARLGFQCWLRKNPLPYPMVCPVMQQDYYMRLSYYGGKAFPCRPRWRPEFDGDQIMALDVVSLYPFVMKTFPYAVAKHVNSMYPITDPQSCFKVHQHLESMAKKLSQISLSDWESISELFKKSGIAICEVDITPPSPSDLLVAYLPERDFEQNRVIYCMNDKKNQVYTSIDIVEALRLGYKLNKVHSYVGFLGEWNKPHILFKTFIDELFDLKKTSPKTSPMYQLAKLTMVAPSGKFGQKPNASETLVFYDWDQAEKFYSNSVYLESALSNKPQYKLLLKNSENENYICSVDRLCNKHGIDSAYLVHGIKGEGIRPEYPVYMSAQILAYSRLVMSHYMEIAGCYHVRGNEFFITDTDSLVIPMDGYSRLIKHQQENNRVILGKELGQLDNDLPNSVITGFIGIAPKLYIIEYKTKDETLWKVRAKGIPHTSESLPVAIYKDLEPSNNHHKNKMANKMVEKYSLIDEHGQVQYERCCLTWDMYEKVLMYNYTMSASFTTFGRKMIDKNDSIFLQKSNIDRRIIGAEWWKSNKCREFVNFNINSYQK